MFSILTALGVSFILLSATCGALASASIDRRRDSAGRDAADLWQAIRIRNGITAPSPWHGLDAAINRPGMVEIKPTSPESIDPPLHPWESEAIPGDRPPCPSDMATKPPGNLVSTGSTLVNEPDLTPLELTNPPVTGEQARVVRLHQEGLSQTATIKAVWGIPRGGSKKYYEARRRYIAYTTASETLPVATKTAEIPALSTAGENTSLTPLEVIPHA